MSARHQASRRIATTGTLGILTVLTAALMGAAPANATETDADHVHGSRTTQARIQQAWLDDPNQASNPKTARTHTFNSGTAQVRFGSHGGTRYGWGRALNADQNHWIRFEIDLDGDRSWDEYEAWRIGARHYTSGYPTSPSADRAFRACIVVRYNDGCVTGGNATTWW